MTQVVWKHKLGPELNQLTLPRRARVLSVGIQDAIVLWETHDVREDAVELREFWVVGTGLHYPDGYKHVGTVLTQLGAYVFHVFERQT